MKQGIERAVEEGRPVEYRELSDWVDAPTRLHPMVLTGYVGAIQGRGEIHIDCGDQGLVIVKAPDGADLWPIYCHNVRVTIEDQGGTDG